MGVIDDVFSGASQKEGAANTRSYLNLIKQQQSPMIDDAYVRSTGALAENGNQARDALGYGYSEGSTAVRQGEADALASLRGGSGQAMGYLDAAKGAYSPLSALAGKYGAGTDTYMDALGLRGAEGNARASAAFTPSMAYNFNLDQGLEAINRHRAQGGMLNSGNADRDAQEYGAGLASREQGSWMDRLAGLINPEMAATSAAATGVAGLGRDQATLANSTGVAEAGLSSQRGSMLADLANKYGTNEATSYMTEGKNLSDVAQQRAKMFQDLALGIAGPYAQTYKTEADAATAGSTNAFNLGKEALTTGAKIIGGFA